MKDQIGGHRCEEAKRTLHSSPGVGISSPVSSSEAALHYVPKYIAHQSDCGKGSSSNFIHYGTHDGEDYHTGRVSHML